MVSSSKILDLIIVIPKSLSGTETKRHTKTLAKLTVGLGGRIVGYEVLNSGGYFSIPDIEIIDADNCPGFGQSIPNYETGEKPDGPEPPPVEMVFCPRNTCYYF